VVQIRKTQLRDPRAAAEALIRQRRAAAPGAPCGRAGQARLSRDTDAERRIADTLPGAAIDRDRVSAICATGDSRRSSPRRDSEVLAGTERPGHR
jgi:hypothetical protein